MSDKPVRMGGKIRGLRRREQITQAHLAERLGISASYLNLIENNRRPLTAPLLIKLAQQFELNLRDMGPDKDAQLVAELLEVFGDPMFEAHELTNADISDLAHGSPAIAQAVPTLYRAFKSAQESATGLAAKISQDDEDDEDEGSHRYQLPSEEVSDVLQRHRNYFPILEEAAEQIRRSADLVGDEGDPFSQLVRGLEQLHGVSVRLRHRATMASAVRRFDAERKVLSISEGLTPGSRNFQIAHILGLLSHRETLNRLVDAQHKLSPQSRDLCRVAFANYFASAVLMPYDLFHRAAEAERYDIELLSRRFITSFEQVCHRFTTLGNLAHAGVPFHLVRIDIAGNISKRFSAGGLHFPRFSASCPLWNVHSAFHTPGRISVQLSRMPDGATYLSVARTLRRSSGGYGSPGALQAIAVGCEVQHARRLVYSEGIDLDAADSAVPVGMTCRLCERLGCEQRAFPPLHHPLHIDEKVRGISFYAPVT